MYFPVLQMTLGSDKDTDAISITSAGSSTQRVPQDFIIIDVYGVQAAGIRLVNFLCYQIRHLYGLYSFMNYLLFLLF
jgi:hypothetical protein